MSSFYSVDFRTALALYYDVMAAQGGMPCFVGAKPGPTNIEITNFSSSWEDGLALCAVYHTYLPAHIPYSTLTPQDKKGNLDLAFLTGESVGITAELTVTEMLKTGGPNWQRVLSYVESIFRHFEM